MPIIGTPRTFHKKFKFVVEIDQFQSAGFQKCSELSVEVANIEYHEGGSLIPNKSPGRLKFAPLVKRYYGRSRRRASNTITI
jgi:phage tail-like protein